MKTTKVDELATKADAAFVVAARRVIEEARLAGDGIITWRDGRVVEISCDEAERLLDKAIASDDRQCKSDALPKPA